jgi:threonine dehydrogenase-like Zn-dependent dehydrogenase
VIAWTALAIPLAALLALAVGYWLSDNDCGTAAAAPGRTMKAIVYCDYGTADVLRLEDVEKPTPGDDELLVRVHAAGVNPLDWHYMRGTPYVMRLGSGLRKPKDTRLGVDYAGTVEAVGRNVTRVSPGDQVFGGVCALAQYVVAKQDGAVALSAGQRQRRAGGSRSDRRHHRAAGTARRWPAPDG